MEKAVMKMLNSYLERFTMVEYSQNTVSFLPLIVTELDMTPAFSNPTMRYNLISHCCHLKEELGLHIATNVLEYSNS